MRGRTWAISTINSNLKMAHFDAIWEHFDKNTTLKQKNNDPESRKLTIVAIQSFFDEEAPMQLNPT